MQRLVLFLMLVIVCPPNAQAVNSVSSPAVFQTALAQNLDRSVEWQRILLMIPRITGVRTSIGDDPTFFLAPDGGKNPRAELFATIAAFVEPWNGAQDADPICLFPRRLMFLHKTIGFELPKTRRPPCTAYNDWRKQHPTTGLSYVFAANYLNNPASMYGHTFIRLHMPSDDGGKASPLLDDAVNFAANMTNDNMFLYPVLGLTGRFFGTFTLLPYYLKVQEYNNSETRDLWEYPLNLSPEEVDAFMATLWEVGPHPIRYWYMDENCALVLLLLLSAARPTLSVGDEFPLIASPKDSVNHLRPHGILGVPVRRASALTRFKERHRRLNADEAKLLEAQSRADHLLPALTRHDDASRAKILDALIEWISWKERLAGNRTPKTYPGLWSESLAARAAIPTASPEVAPTIDEITRPDRGHLGQRWGLALRSHTSRHEAILNLRLALHDAWSPPGGYAPDQEIVMGDFQAGLGKNADKRWDAFVERAMLIHILSVPAFNDFNAAQAWTLTLGSQRMWGYDRAGDAWMTHKFEGGAGLAVAQGNVRTWIIPIAEVGRLLPTSHPALHAGLGLRSGIAWDPATPVRLTVTGDVDRLSAARTHATIYDLAQHSSWLLGSSSHEVRLSLHLRGHLAPHFSRSGALQLNWMAYF